MSNNKQIQHPKPANSIFSIIRPVPDYKMQLFDEHPIMDFIDPQTGEEYQAQRIDAAWYPMNLMSRFICRICAQKEPEDLLIEMTEKYRLIPADQIGFYLFKLID